MQPDVAKVQYNYLGRSGLKVSNLCLGAMTFGTVKEDPYGFFDNPHQLNEEKSFEILNRFAEVGGNFIDTANIYSRGNSEEIVGNWLSTQKRERFVIATKCRIPMDGSHANDGGLSRRHITEAVDASLKRLKTDFIDLYQSHAWDSATPIEETMRTMDDLVRCGKVRYIGCSNVCGWQLQKMVCKTESMGLTPYISLQQQYNLLTRGSEKEEFQVCSNEGIGVIPWSPLKSGLLSGKYKRGNTPDVQQGRIGLKLGALQDLWGLYGDDEQFWKLQDKLAAIGKNHSKTVAQVSLRWLLQKDIVPSVIIGVTSLKQLEDNLGAAKGWQLSQEEMNTLDQLTAKPLDNPYDAIERLNFDRKNPYYRN